MKHFFSQAGVFALFAFAAYGQVKNESVQQLNQQLAALYQAGNLDEAVPIAEKIVKLQKEEQPVQTQNLATSLENLARIKLTRFKQRSSRLNSPNLNQNDAKALVVGIKKDATDAEGNFREAIGLIASDPKRTAAQSVGVKSGLAWLLYNYLAADVNLPVSVDKKDRDNFDSLSRSRFNKRIEEAKNLYVDALKEAEAWEPDGDMTLSSLFNLAEFELSMGEFETAIPRYEKCLWVVEKKYGKNDQNLLPPMQSYIKALIATDQDDLAFEVLSRIVRITGKSGQMPKDLLNVTLRADKGFTTSIAPSMEERARANAATAELAGRGSTVNSGTSQGTFAQIQGSSTLGRSYYDNSGAIRIIKIPVRVVIDETGKVSETEGLTQDRGLKIEAERIVRGWTFRPLLKDGKPRKMKGYVECRFLAELLSK